MHMLLGSRIKALRIVRNYTQEQMADQLGISREKYACIENGVNSITLETLAKIAKIMNVTVEDITKILDESPSVAYQSGTTINSFEEIFNMLDLFYANKHMYTKLHARSESSDA